MAIREPVAGFEQIGSKEALDEKDAGAINSRRRLVERIVTSPSFARSPKLNEFLIYICDQALRGEAREINEQIIGERVFGRPPGYDPSQDNIVRANATRLRQKLEIYFKEEGALESIRIVIPRGGYFPLFEPTSVEQETHSDPPFVQHEEVAPPFAATAHPIRNERPLFVHWALGAGVLVLMLIAFILGQRGTMIAKAAEEALPDKPKTMPLLWKRMFEADRNTLLVASDSAFLLRQWENRKTIDLTSYISGNVQLVPLIKPAVDLHGLHNRTFFRYTSIGDLRLVTRLMKLPHVDESRLQVRYARDLKMEDIKSSNIVLLGGKDANPWVELFEQQMNFTLEDHLLTGGDEFIVKNRNPNSGEPAQYVMDIKDPTHPAYGLVAFLPIKGGAGSVLIIEGTTMAGTEAAADCLFEGKRLMALLQPQLAPNGSIPYFEALVRTTNIGTNSFGAEVISVRFHND